jgi:hypothetical protein
MDELTETPAKKPKSTKSPTKAATAKKKATAPKSPRGKKSKSMTITISEDQRLGMIAETAYFKAEKRGFSGGNPVDDWLAAESEIDALLANNPAQQANA